MLEARAGFGEMVHSPTERELIPIADGLYRFEDTCNAYAFVEDGAALVIDPGSGAIADALVDRENVDIEWVLHTHHHRDQCWGTGELASAGAQVAVPEYEHHLFADVETFWERKRLYDNYNDRSTFDTLPSSVPVHETLQDYDTFTWRDHAFDILPAKGHTFGSSALITDIDDKRIAFTGDLIHEGGTIHELHQLEYAYGDMKGIPLTIESLNALNRAGLDRLMPSHGPVVDDPDGDIDRLRRRLMSVVDLGRGLDAGTRAYLPEMRMVEVSDHLLWGGPWTCSNFYVIRSESGRGLFIDYGHSMGEHMHVGADREDMETMRFVEHHLDELREVHGIDTFDAVIPTHIHDDHTCGIPHLQEHYDVECWALEDVGKVLADPAAWSSTPCTFSTPITIDRWLEDGAVVGWEEYEFTIRHAPGQTEFHAVVGTDIDGLTVAFTGDNWFEHTVDRHYDDQADRPHQTTVLRNSFRFDMHRQCAAVMESLEPELICPGHGDVLDADARQATRYRDFIERKERVFRELTADPADQRVDLFWARLLPYQVAASPGEDVTYRLRLRNNFQEATEYEARLYGPDGRSILAEGGRTLQPDERGDVTLPVPVEDWGSGRQVLTAEVLVDGDSRGPVAEAVIELP